jgi:hypothetical protein
MLCSERFIEHHVTDWIELHCSADMQLVNDHQMGALIHHQLVGQYDQQCRHETCIQATGFGKCNDLV